jgi:hypothetical protein
LHAPRAWDYATIAAKLCATTLGGGERVFGALADHSPFFFGHHRHDANRGRLAFGMPTTTKSTPSLVRAGSEHRGKSSPASQWQAWHYMPGGLDGFCQHWAIQALPAATIQEISDRAALNLNAKPDFSCRSIETRGYDRSYSK